MDIDRVHVVSVSYNSAELVNDLLKSFRTFYANPVTIVDGSTGEHVEQTRVVCSSYADVTFVHFDYNIHHGPGIAWAIQNLECPGGMLVLDSDVVILKHGFLESMANSLRPEMYGVGSINHVNEGGYDVRQLDCAIRYLHPACMLCNVDVMRRWPLPIKHGAPMIEAMKAIHRAGKPQLIGQLDWLHSDFSPTTQKTFIRHDWQGTVKRSGGYNLEEWQAAERQASTTRTLILHLLPKTARRIVEISTNHGPLEREFKSINPRCVYDTLYFDANCQSSKISAHPEIVSVDLGRVDDAFFEKYLNSDCWILDEILDRLENPTQLLKLIRKVISSDASVIAVIPNMQHWRVQAKLCIGDFRYGSTAILKAGTQHFFTRATIFETFNNSGFRIIEGFPVDQDPLVNERVKEAIKGMALSVGADPDLSLQDSQPSQYIIKAVPV